MIADLATRETVLDPTQSFIVQAPAGSGKTELLITRYLRLLATVSQPEEIVALTFTRKAAAEMKNRIIATLHKAKHGGDLLPATRAIAEAALARDTQAGWHLLNQPARLQVLTLDAFCTRLLARLPNQTGLPESVQVTEQPERYYLTAVQRLLSHIDQDSPLAVAISELFHLWDNRWKQAQDALVDLLAERAQWLPLFFELSTDDPAQIILERYHAWVQDCLERADKLLSEKQKNEWLHLWHYQQAQLALPYEALDSFPSCGHADLAKWQNCIALVLTKDYTWRMKIDKSLGFPAESGLSNPEEKALAKVMNQKLKHFIEELSATPKLLHALQAIQSLSPIALTEQQIQLLNLLTHTLLPALLIELDRVFAEAGQADFTAVTQRTLQALGQPDDPGDLLLLLDEKIQHILVDEFQDTAPVQYDLLALLTSGWTVGDGRTLFLVGDPQQSIYGFRAAEVGLFLRAKNYGVGQIKLIPTQLEMNFRATPTLVTWYNQLFSSLFPQDEDWIHGAITFSPAQAFPKKEQHLSQIHWHPYAPEKETETLLHCIAKIRQHSPTGSIAILVRNRLHGEDAIQILSSANIPLQAIGISQLYDHPAIHDALALLRALLQRQDRTHWLAILRAPWCGLSLADIAILCPENTKDNLIDSMNNSNITQHLSHDGALRLKRILPILNHALGRLGHDTIARTMQTTWLELGGDLCWSDNLARKALQNFWQILHQHCVTHPGGWHPELFIEHLQLCTLDYPPGPLHAIQVLTMHKAKGLEFDHVILFGLERSGRADSGGLLRWQATTPVGPLLAPKTIEETPNLYHTLAQWQSTRSQLEEERLLYVAITRARQQLHFVFELLTDEKGWKSPRSNSLLSKLWPHIHHALPCPPQTIVESTDTQDLSLQPPALVRLPLEWIPQFTTETLQSNTIQPWFQSAERQDAMLMSQILGTVMHEILYDLHRGKEQHWAQFLRDGTLARWQLRLAEFGLQKTAQEKIWQNIILALTTIQNDPRAHWLLQHTHQDSQAEFALREKLDVGERRHVIDRTFIDQGIRWIVDYKTTVPGNRTLETFLDDSRTTYQDQLQRYADILTVYDTQCFGQPLPIRLGLYFPLIPAWTEWEMVEKKIV